MEAFSPMFADKMDYKAKTKIILILNALGKKSS
jgi:hypothetical protein